MNTSRTKLHIFILIFLFSLIALAGCGAKEDPYRSFLRYGLSSAPVSLDPAVAQDSAGKLLLNTIGEGLFRQKPDGSLEEALASGWDMEEDGLKYTFKIKDAAWPDGSKVTAPDFVFAWMRALEPQMDSPYAYLLYNIKNAEGYNRAGDADYFGNAAAADAVGLSAPDDSTLVVELASPDPAFYKKLTHPVFFPLPEQKVRELGEAYFTPENIAANGPFAFAPDAPEGAYVLTKNAAYWDAEKVALPGLVCYLDTEAQDTWQMFKEGRIDLTLAVPQGELQEQKEEGKLFASPLLANYYYQFNTAKAPLRDLRVRLALSLALDRTYLVEEILQGGQYPAQGIIPHFAAERLTPDNNLEEARRLLAEAGFSGGEFPELQLLTADEESHLYLAEYLQKEWQEQLGIKVNIVPLAAEERRSRLIARDYDLALAGWFVDYHDETEFLESFVFRLGQNTSGWSDAQYDALVASAKSALTQDERLAFLQQAEQILLDGLPVLLLYDYTRVYVQNGRVEGFYIPPAGAEAEFKWTALKDA